MTKKPYTKPTLDTVPTAKVHADRRGWYWAPDGEGPYHGPFETKALARAEGIQDDPKAALVVRFMQPVPVSTDAFRAEDVLEQFENHNEDAVWDEYPLDGATPEAQRELETMLAQALYVWAEKHNYWSQFRALEEVFFEDDDDTIDACDVRDALKRWAYTALGSFDFFSNVDSAAKYLDWDAGRYRLCRLAQDTAPCVICGTHENRFVIYYPDNGRVYNTAPFRHQVYRAYTRDKVRTEDASRTDIMPPATTKTRKGD